MRRLVPILLVLCAESVAPAPAPAAGELRSCKRVSFTPQSDDLAGAIRARGVRCRYTRRFVRATEGRPPVVRNGWRCTSRVVDDAGLAYTRVNCTRSGDLMRWKRY